MRNSKLDLSSQTRRGFIQTFGIAALAPLISNIAFAQPSPALASSSKGMVTSPHGC